MWNDTREEIKDQELRRRSELLQAIYTGGRNGKVVNKGKVRDYSIALLAFPGATKILPQLKQLSFVSDIGA